jgi:hypothetical protein
MTTKMIRNLLTGFAVLTLAVAPGMGMERQTEKRTNSYVKLGMTSKAPYSMKRISKVKTTDGKAEARKNAAKPTTMKPGQFAKGIPAPATADAPAAMNAD